MAKVLVVGGAGYVGSATAAYLVDHGHQVWVLDDLSTGRKELFLGEELIVADTGDTEVVRKWAQKVRFDCVYHFAAKTVVSESFALKDVYLQNNVVKTKALLSTLLDQGISRFVFSSTCAVFGDPGDRRIDETLPKNPLSPYGENKLEIENHLETLAAERGLQSIALRYFNAAGAESKLRVGEWHEPETHLIPRVIASAQQSKAIDVFGNDYATKDGTCVRDYVHVSDLAAAHVASMERMQRLPKSAGKAEAYNLGSEVGFTVLEVIEATRKVSGSKLEVNFKPRRPGDATRLVADSSLAKQQLGYRPRFTKIDEIVKSAWDWHSIRSTRKAKK